MEIAYKKMYSFQDLLEKYRALCDLEFVVLGLIGHIFIGKLTRVWTMGFLYFTNEATGREVSVRRYHEKGKIYLHKYDNGKDVEIQDMFEVFQK